MLAVLSPAKKLDFHPPVLELPSTRPALVRETHQLMKTTRQLSVEDLARLMKLSEGLAQLNYERFQEFSVSAKAKKGMKQAALTFNGDTYVGLNASTFDTADFEFAQGNVRILSGLYGVLKPLDLIQAYRLEMGTKLSTARGKNLYDYWGDKIALQLNQEIETHQSKVIVNLASNEYFAAADRSALKPQIITCTFKEQRGDSAKVIGFSAKRARGMMARYIVKQRLVAPEGMKKFSETGYRFVKSASTDDNYVFVRPEK